MIAELFYPKELKEIIADLRAKGDLDEGALKNFDGYVYSTLQKIIIVNLLFSLFFFHPNAGEGLLIIIVISIIVMIYGLKIGLSNDTKRIASLYNSGAFVKGVVESYGTHRGAFGITCFFNWKNNNKRSHIHGVRIGLNRKRYKKGDTILICYDPKNPDNNVPFIPSLAKMFYLRKETPNGNN